MTHENILAINAHLKYVEFILYIFDNESNDLTLGEIKSQFKEKFNTDHKLLNQNFGIYRLLPLILIKEEYKNQKLALNDDIEKIKVIRDAISHHKFNITEDGYIFKNNKHEITFTYQDFQDFLHRIENEFYANNLNTSKSTP